MVSSAGAVPFATYGALLGTADSFLFRNGIGKTSLLKQIAFREVFEALWLSLHIKLTQAFRTGRHSVSKTYWRDAN